jgi:hypothetical protein
MFQLFSLDGSSAHKILTLKKKKRNYANRSSRTSDITVIKIASLFNNLIGTYMKKVTFKNFLCPGGKIRMLYKMFSHQ